MFNKIFLLIKNEYGEIGKAKNEYVINGVTYIADSEFRNDGDGTSLEKQIKRLLQNEKIMVKWHQNVNVLTAEKEDKCS